MSQRPPPTRAKERCLEVICVAGLPEGAALLRFSPGSLSVVCLECLRRSCRIGAPRSAFLRPWLICRPGATHISSLKANSPGKICKPGFNLSDPASVFEGPSPKFHTPDP